MTLSRGEVVWDGVSRARRARAFLKCGEPTCGLDARVVKLLMIDPGIRRACALVRGEAELARTCVLVVCMLFPPLVTTLPRALGY